MAMLSLFCTARAAESPPSPMAPEGRPLPHVTTLAELASDYARQQAEFLPLSAPDPAFIHLHHAGLLTFAPAGFPESFLRGLIPADRQGITVYPVTLYEDAGTRDYVILNAAGVPIGLVPPPLAYDPRWFVERWYKDLYAPGRPAAETAWLAALYDPARVAVSYDMLLPLEADRFASAQAAARALRAPPSTLQLAWDGGSVTSLCFTLIVAQTNGVALTLAYPDGFTNRLDIFRCEDLVPFWWALALATNADLSTNHICWLDASATNPLPRFYAAANADVDTDADGLSDGREKYLHRTNPAEADSDGDGLTDYEEVIDLDTDPNNDDTNRPVVHLVFPAQNAYRVWFP